MNDDTLKSTVENIHILDVYFRRFSVEEVGILYDEGAPPVQVFEESKIGILHSALKSMFKYSIQKFQQMCQKERGSTSQQSGATIEEFIRLMRPILIVKGDMPTILNVRKELLSIGNLDYSEELLFLDVVMWLHPKSPSLWEHRRLVLRACLAKGAFNDEELALRELKVCAQLCDKYPRNYFGWNHRLWVLNTQDHNEILHDELSSMKTWIRQHPSDHSAVAYFHRLVEKITGSFLPSKLVSTFGHMWKCREVDTGDANSPLGELLLLLSLLGDNEKQIELFLDFETSWCHRRSIWSLVIAAAKKLKHQSSRGQDVSQDTVAGGSWEDARATHVETITKLLEDILSLRVDISRIEFWVLRLIHREIVFVSSIEQQAQVASSKQYHSRFLEWIIHNAICAFGPEGSEFKRLINGLDFVHNKGARNIVR